jgi:SOS-response transcriptional repressor LexA
MSHKLTQKQQDVLDFMKTYVADWGYSPSVSDIAHAFGWKSGNAAQTHLNALQSKGYIKLSCGVARGTTIIGCGNKASAEDMASALRVISTWAAHDKEKGVRQALDPKHVLDLCNKALHREVA